MLGNTEISASQVSRLLPSIPTDVLAETFAALLNQIKIEKQVTTVSLYAFFCYLFHSLNHWEK